MRELTALLLTALGAAACVLAPNLGGGEVRFSIASEAPGDACPNGGRVIRSGRDGNGNGSLDEDEVTEEQHVCDGGGSSACSVLTRFDGDYFGQVDGSAVGGTRWARVDPEAGTFLLEGPALDSGYSGLAYDPIRERLYGLSRVEGQSQLLNVAFDGTASLIAPLSAPDFAIDLAFDPLGGSAYALLHSDDTGRAGLYRVDPDTGAATSVADLGAVDAVGVGALALGPDCRIYATLDTLLFAYDPARDELEKVIDLDIRLDALLFDGERDHWFGLKWYEGGQFVRFQQGEFTASVVGGEQPEFRSLVKLPQ